jgi:alpha-D-xyloside xylohydrolase
VCAGREAGFALRDDGVANAYEKGPNEKGGAKIVRLPGDDTAGKLTASDVKGLSAQALEAVQVVR